MSEWDAELKRMQIRWHELRGDWLDSGSSDSSQQQKAFDFWDAKLKKFLWDKAAADIERDRRAHPKAKRNQPVPARPEVGEGFVPPGRALP